ncbi:glycoside hydrolase family 3 N-terminal domain-containing protein [Patescibacteria group bacterium]
MKVLASFFKNKIHLIFIILILIIVSFELVYFLRLKPFYYPITLTPQDLEVSFTPEHPLDRKITSMSLEEKVGMLFMVGFDGLDITLDQEEFFQKYKFVNFLLLGKNIENTKQLKQLTQKLNIRHGFSRPLIALDQEGGQVNRVNFDGIDNTSQAEVISKDQAYRLGKERAKLLASYNINMNLAPVLEVIRNNNSYLNFLGRSFIGDEDQVYLLGKAMIKGYGDEQILTVPKHYPGGLGRTNINPHYSLPIIEIGKEELTKDLSPMQKLISENKIAALMITHLKYPEIDKDNITSLSEVFISQILRDNLKFKGVIIVDDLAMKAISNLYTASQAAMLSFKAGADMIIISESRQDQEQAFKALLDNAKNSSKIQARVDKSVKKILQLGK